MAEKKSGVTTQIFIEQTANDKLQSWLDTKGRTKTVVVAKVLTWFARQPDVIKSVVLGDVDEGLQQATASMLRRMADEITRPLDSAPPVVLGPASVPRSDPPSPKPKQDRKLPARAG